MKKIRFLIFLGCMGIQLLGDTLLPYSNEATRNGLIHALKDEDRIRRVRALLALSSVDDPRNLEQMVQLTKDSVEAVRLQAVCLTNQPSERTVPDIFKERPVVPDEQITQTHRDPRVRKKARLQLLEADPAYKDDFTELLRDDDYFVRRSISEKVIQLRGSKTLEIWRKLLVSTQVHEQIESAWAIGQLKSTADEVALVGFLRSDSERLRLVSIDALMKIGSDATRQALSGAMTGASDKVYKELTHLAIQLKAVESLPAFRQIVTDPKASEDHRRLALEVMTELHDVGSQEIFLKLAATYSGISPELRRQAVCGLGKMEVTAGIVPIKKLMAEKVISVPMVGMNYDADEVRIACLTALKQLKVGGDLVKLLNHSSITEGTEKLRKAYAETLSEVTGKNYDYRRDVNFKNYFLESLLPKEYPPEVKVNMEQPPVFESGNVSKTSSAKTSFSLMKEET